MRKISKTELAEKFEGRRIGYIEILKLLHRCQPINLSIFLVKCHYCGRTFTIKYASINTILRKDIEKQNKWKCKKCALSNNKNFKGKKMLEKTENSQNTCRICGKQTKNRFFCNHCLFHINGGGFDEIFTGGAI